MRVDLPWRHRLREKAPAFDPCLMLDTSGMSTLAQEASEQSLDWDVSKANRVPPPAEPTPEVA